MTFCRYVFDGWPVTKAQVDLLNKYQIIPIAIAEIEVSNEKLLIRADYDRNSVNRYSEGRTCIFSVPHRCVFSVYN